MPLLTSNKAAPIFVFPRSPTSVSFFPSVFIVNCLHNPWAYSNLSLNVFHFPFVSFSSIDLPYLIFLHYSKIHLAAVQHSYLFPFWLSLRPNYQPN